MYNFLLNTEIVPEKVRLNVANFKKILMRSFFIAELLFFSMAYLFGKHGIRKIRQLRRENYMLDRTIAELSKEVAYLKNECNAWQNDPFYKEKIAREQLQMIKPGEELYYYQLHKEK